MPLKPQNIYERKLYPCILSPPPCPPHPLTRTLRLSLNKTIYFVIIWAIAHWLWDSDFPCLNQSLAKGFIFPAVLCHLQNNTDCLLCLSVTPQLALLISVVIAPWCAVSLGFVSDGLAYHCISKNCLVCIMSLSIICGIPSAYQNHSLFLIHSHCVSARLQNWYFHDSEQTQLIQSTESLYQSCSTSSNRWTKPKSLVFIISSSTSIQILCYLHALCSLYVYLKCNTF